MNIFVITIRSINNMYLYRGSKMGQKQFVKVVFN